MNYDAFISYRHTPSDMEFAKKLHTGLETYRVPGAVKKKTGKKKIERVFRDQEELPIGSDLGENISAALAESEFLIVICSPETPGSYWVGKEIDTFVAMHGRQNVLAMLIDGEPEQSFPQQLLRDELGNTVEPLAADVRGATAAERNKKFKTELLRLLAPILGCTYDDLRQRHRERILKRHLSMAAAAAGIIAAAGAVFGVYNAQVANRMKKLADEKAVLAEEKSELADSMSKLAYEKSLLASEKTKLADEKTELAEKILTEFREKQENQSRFYAEEAMAQLQSGNREDAVLIALAGLPSAGEDRPFVPEAEYALSSALHAYDCGREIAVDRLLPHEDTVTAMRLDKSATHLASIDLGNRVYVWAAETGKQLGMWASDTSVKVVSAYADAKGYIIAYGKTLERIDYSGESTGFLSFEQNIGLCEFDDNNDRILAVCRETCYVISLTGFTVQAEIPLERDDATYSECLFTKDGTRAVLAYSIAREEKAGFIVIDLTEKTADDIPLGGVSILDLTVTEAGRIALITANADFYYTELTSLTLSAYDVTSGAKQYESAISVADWNSGFTVRIGSRVRDGLSELVVTGDTHLYCFDEESGKQILHVTLPGTATTLYLSGNSANVFVGLNNGNIISVSSEDGRMNADSAISTGLPISGMLVLNGGIVVQARGSDGLTVFRYHEAYDLSELPDLPAEAEGYGVSPNGKYYVLEDRFQTGLYTFYDTNGNFLDELDAGYSVSVTGFYGETYVVAARSGITLVEPISGDTEEITYEELGFGMSCKGGAFSPDGRYLALYGFSAGVAVIDLESRRLLFSEETLTPEELAITPDGLTLFVSESGRTLLKLDLVSGTTEEMTKAYLFREKDALKLRYLACDPAGTYVAMACSDGYVRIQSIKTGENMLAIPLATRSTCFLGFTKDGQHILVEGDDLRVRVYRITDGACLSSFDVPLQVSYMIEDDGFLALCDNYTVSLIDRESFGRLAYVPYAATYIAHNEEFILVSGRRAWTTEYKNNEELADEAARQFPGAELSLEKRVLYNIE